MSSPIFLVYKLSRENIQPENICKFVFYKAKGRGGTVNRTTIMQKQHLKGFYKKSFLTNFAKFARKKLRRSVFFIMLDVVDLQLH